MKLIAAIAALGKLFEALTNFLKTLRRKKNEIDYENAANKAVTEDDTTDLNNTLNELSDRRDN